MVSIVVPVLVVCVVFGRAVGFPFVEWDDARYIVGNPLVAGGGAGIDYLFTPQLGYIVPVTVALERLLYLVGGGAAWPFHLASLLCHAASAVLIGRIARELRAEPRAATVAAIVWAVHPIAVEPVAWATGLKDTLSALLALGSLYALLRERDRATVLLGVLAFLAKPTTLLLPAVVFVLQPRRRAVWLPLVAAALLVGGLSLMMRLEHAPDGGGVQATFISALGAQALHLVAPIGLQPIYLVARTPSQYLAAAVVAAAGVFALWRGSWQVRAAVVLACAAYLPSSQLISFSRTMADSFVYLPLAGIVLAIAVAARPQIFVVAGVIVATVFAVLSFRQVDRWASNEKLWRPVIVADPEWAYPWVLLAQGYDFEARPRDAAHAYGQAFARQYLPQYLASYAIALYAAHDPDAACVFVEDRERGPDRARAERNLERLGALPPELAQQPWPERNCAALRLPVERVGAP